MLYCNVALALPITPAAPNDISATTAPRRANSNRALLLIVRPCNLASFPRLEVVGSFVPLHTHPREVPFRLKAVTEWPLTAAAASSPTA